MPQATLQTDRIRLVPLGDEHLEHEVELDADPAVMRYVTGKATPRAEIEEEILPAFLSYYERFPGYGFWAAIEKTTGDFLGWFHLRPAAGHPEDEPELGYRLRRAAWGKGYATEGSRALVAKAFAELGARRVVAEAMAVNLASRRVMEKVGLTLVRTFHQEWPERLEGDEHGDVEYALERAEWERRHASGKGQPAGEDGAAGSGGATAGRGDDRADCAAGARSFRFGGAGRRARR